MNWDEKCCEPFIFSWTHRGAPLNDVLWYLTCPVIDGVDYEIDPSCGTCVHCSSAHTLDEARKKAVDVVKDIKRTIKHTKD